MLKSYFILLFILLSLSVFSQKVSKNNYTGDWTNNSSWIGNSAPGVNNILTNCIINGKITRVGNLDFVLGDLIIDDTLIIFGNLTLGNNSDLIIHDKGIIIIYGDYSSNNQTNVEVGGYFVVTGNFNMKGSTNQGKFTVSDGSVFILDNTPIIKDGSNYTDLNCSNPLDYPSNCGYGNINNLITSPIKDLFLSPYSLLILGTSEFCEGGGVTLYITNSFTNYQWYNNGVAISGANSYTYTTMTSGSYYLKFDIGTLRMTTNTVNTTKYDIVFLPNILSNNMLIYK